MESIKKAEAVTRITEWLLRGHLLTAAEVVERFAPRAVTLRTARGWLKAVNSTLGERVQCRRIDGATQQYRYCAETSAARDQLEQAAFGLHLAERALEPLTGTRLLGSIRAAEDAIAARLDGAARSRSIESRDVLLRPQLPRSRVDAGGVIETIVAAIRCRRALKFEYTAANRDPKPYQVHPWSLIDHGDGLYLFCVKANDADHLRTFDLRGMENVRKTEARFTRPENVRQRFADYREGYFGIYVDLEAKPEWIELSVRAYARHFLARRPLARQQTITEAADFNGWAQLRAYVAVTPELVGRLLMLSPHIRVRSPAELERKHLNRLTLASKNYGI